MDAVVLYPASFRTTPKLRAQQTCPCTRLIGPVANTEGIEIIPVGNTRLSLIHPLAIANGWDQRYAPQVLSIRQQFPTQAIINLAGTLIINRP